MRFAKLAGSGSIASIGWTDVDEFLVDVESLDLKATFNGYEKHLGPWILAVSLGYGLTWHTFAVSAGERAGMVVVLHLRWRNSMIDEELHYLSQAFLPHASALLPC